MILKNAMDFGRQLTTSFVGNQFTGSPGGSFTLSSNDVSLHGDAWSVMKLSTYHTFDIYSRLSLSFSVITDDTILVLCFMSDLSDYRSCLQISGTTTMMVMEGDNSMMGTPTSNDLPSSAKMYNLALGKPTSQSSPNNEFGSKSSNAVDGMFHGVVSSSLEKDPWWEVDLEGFFAVKQVVLHVGTSLDETTNFDSRTSNSATATATDDFIISDMIVQLFDDFGNIVFQTNIAPPQQQQQQQQPSTSFKNSIIVDIPHGTRAAKVRVQMRGDNKVLFLTEVQVIELVFKPTVDIDIPIASLFGVKTIQYVALIQKDVQVPVVVQQEDKTTMTTMTTVVNDDDGGENNHKEYGESYISGLRLHYGYSPDEEEI